MPEAAFAFSSKTRGNLTSRSHEDYKGRAQERPKMCFNFKRFAKCFPCSGKIYKRHSLLIVIYTNLYSYIY